METYIVRHDAMPNPLVDKLFGIVSPPVEAAGYELVDLEWKREPGGWVLRVYIDRPSGRPEGAPGAGGAISHSDCERVSRQLSAVLDVEDVIPQAYHLEVSSPGVERPLRTPEHFRRFEGRKARVRLRHGVDGRRNFSGTIVGVTDGRVRVDVEGGEVELPLDDLDKANLIFEWSGSQRCNRT